MSHEIKFRAERFGKIYEVLEWKFTGKQDVLLGINGKPVLRERLKNLNMMQFTGLRDENGVEIYENIRSKGTFAKIRG